MVHDAKLASPTAVGKNLRMQREEEEARLPPVKPVKSFSDQLTSATAAIANDEQPVYSNPTHGEALIDSSPPAIGDDIPQQTIAQGLDAFLLHPHAMRIEVFERFICCSYNTQINIQLISHIYLVCARSCKGYAMDFCNAFP